MRVLFTDTETPGFKKPLRPVEVAGFFVNSVQVSGPPQEHFFERFNLRGTAMEYGAVATHHILHDELKDEPDWDGPAFRRRTMPLVNYVVAHNVDFDMEVLGIQSTPSICTLALSRLWQPDLDSHKLGALMYHMYGMNEGTRQQLQGAHSARADIAMTWEWLQSAIEMWAPATKNWAELHELSELGRIPLRFTFGKYGPKDGKPGMKICDFIRELPANPQYRSYLTWMKRELSDDIYLMKALANPRKV